MRYPINANIPSDTNNAENHLLIVLYASPSFSAKKKLNINNPIPIPNKIKITINMNISFHF